MTYIIHYLILSAFISSPEKRSLSYDWEYQQSHSYIVYSENSVLKMDTFDRRYDGTISYKIDSAIDSFIVLPYQGKPQFVTTDTDTALRPISQISIKIIYTNDSIMDHYPIEKLNRALAALRVGYELEAEFVELDETVLSDTDVRTNDVIQELMDINFIDGQSDIYLFPRELIDDYENHRAYVEPLPDGQMFMAFEEQKLDQTFLFLHELLHIFTDELSDISGHYCSNGLTFRNIMSPDDLSPNYAIMGEYLLASHDINDTGLDSFVVCAIDLSRVDLIPETSTTDCQEFADCESGDCFVVQPGSNPTFKSMYVENVTDVLNKQYDNYFKGVGAIEKDKFVNEKIEAYKAEKTKDVMVQFDLKSNREMAEFIDLKNKGEIEIYKLDDTQIKEFIDIQNSNQNIYKLTRNGTLILRNKTPEQKRYNMKVKNQKQLTRKTKN